jgi:SAM-dependent methyltransferase
MSEVSTGVRRILRVPAIYNLFIDLVGAGEARIRWVRDFLQPFPGARILDIGCGTAEMLGLLPADVDYTGFDMSEAYIDAAKRRYGTRGRFTCAKVEAFGSGSRGPDVGGYDIALAFGVLHHLDDGECRSLFQGAREALKPGGRLVTLDPCYLDGQSYLAKFVVSHDRGQNVRFPEAYAALGKPSFSDIAITVQEKPLRIPTQNTVLVCRG